MLFLGIGSVYSTDTLHLLPADRNKSQSLDLRELIGFEG